MNGLFIKRQIDALKRMGGILLTIPGLLKPGSIVKLAASLLLFAQLIGAVLFDTPTTPNGPSLDLSKFTLTWSDEFDAGTFNKTYWSGHYCWGDDGTWPRDTAFWNRQQAGFRDGNLIISASYLENGPVGPEGPYGPAYYSYGMDTNPGTDGPGKTGFEQLYGYFEMRCILPKGAGLNPAFWLLCEGMFNTDPDSGLTDGGVTGCEIDVFETRYEKEFLYNDSVYHTIHVDSYDEYHRSEMQGHFYADNPYEKFNTYGLEWNPDGYIFYINGVESARTDFGGVCQVPLYLIISLGVGENISENENLPAEFIVDYVRAYQYTDRL